jgi:hypothetical protein
MKKLFVILLMMIPLLSNAQTEQEKCFIYNIVSFSGDVKSEGIGVYIDNGKEVKRLKDEKGKKVVFRTTAGALMYILSQGWEMYINGSNTSGGVVNGIGATSTSPYWIVRNPCTKEEFEKAVEDAKKD